MVGLSVAFLLAGLSLVQGGIVPYTFNITSTEVNPDGFPRNATTVNGIMPGPVITGNKGDDFMVLVNNNLQDPNMYQSVTIHWHGILQRRTNYDDGPAQVTQCPIAPGHSYQYMVETGDSEGGQAGTYWYHSHLGAQYVDGLRGALVIYGNNAITSSRFSWAQYALDPNDPHKDLYDVDDKSTIITLTDWYHESAKKLGDDWINNRTIEPIPDANLLNGVGRYLNGPPTPRAVINVVQGKRYRFRIINMSAIIPFNFTVEGHNVTVIEADGVSHQPYEVSSVGIAAGQRYSVVLNANQPVRNYWIAYPSNFRDTITTPLQPNYNGTEAFAILRYENAPDAEPTTPQITPSEFGVFQEYQLKPLESPAPPGPNEPTLNLTLNFRPQNGNGSIGAIGGANVWKINDVQYTPPKIPTLLQILSMGANQTGGLPPDVQVLPRNTSITVQLVGDDHHPFHLHGHTFQVIQSAFGPRNEIDPPVRDTVETNNFRGNQSAQAVVIRFRTDNPGPWFLHCHKDWHLEAGLAVVFAEDPAGVRDTIHPPPAWEQLCDIYNALPPSQQ
ncbi:laccase [Hysterangium stoloniferum]|nr:laccase [Hysterangium stoloniferum]